MSSANHHLSSFKAPAFCQTDRVGFNIRISCFEECPPVTCNDREGLTYKGVECLTKQVDCVVDCCCSRFPSARGQRGGSDGVPAPRPHQHFGGVQGDGGVAARNHQYLQFSAVRQLSLSLSLSNLRCLPDHPQTWHRRGQTGPG